MRNWKYFTEDGFRSCYFDKQISVIKIAFHFFFDIGNQVENLLFKEKT